VTVQKQLLGRGLVGPRVALGPGVSPLWQFFLSPSSQNSVLIYNNGDVVEQQTFANDVIKSPDVHTYILGGADFRTDEGSFEYNALTDAGYTWRNVYSDNVYPETYDSQFN